MSAHTLSITAWISGQCVCMNTTASLPPQAKPHEPGDLIVVDEAAEEMFRGAVIRAVEDALRNLRSASGPQAAGDETDLRRAVEDASHDVESPE
jgi:hypothetical protein